MFGSGMHPDLKEAKGPAKLIALSKLTIMGGSERPPKGISYKLDTHAGATQLERGRSSPISPATMVCN